MKISFRKWFFRAAMAGLCAFAGTVHAQGAEPAAPPAPPLAVEAPDTPDVVGAPDAAEAPAAPDAEAPDTDDTAAVDQQGPPQYRWSRQGRHRSNRGNERVVVGGNATLRQGERADSVVSVLGSSTSEGDAGDVVSVGGDTRVTGTAQDVVAVLGSVYLNGKASGDVVAIFGDVELGPHAEVGDDVVVVGGTLERDPAAIIHGDVQNVLSFAAGSFDWLRPWVHHCLVLLRPLAIAPGLGWAWGLALGFLGLYVLIALLFPGTVDRCVQTFQEQPGKSIVAALLTTLLTPVMFALLFITVIGIAFVPLAALGLFLAALFGKAIVLAWIGRSFLKLTREGASVHTAIAVLTGGAIVLLLYLVPFVGLIVYKALGVLGLGIAMYALLVGVKQKREDSEPPLAMAGAVAGGGSATFAEPNINEPRAESEPSSDAGPSGTSDAQATSGATSDTGAGGGPSGGASGYAPSSSSAVNSAAASTYPRAGFGVRMAALFIDVILVAVLLGVIDSSKEAELIALATYGAIMWKLKATTIGGIVFGLQVVRVDGRPIDWATATVRALSCFLSLVVAGLGFIWIAFDEGHQAWHDKIAGTAVVRVPKGVSLL